jgi:hypothetical protein
LFVVLLVIAPSSQELRPPAKPGRFTLARAIDESWDYGVPRPYMKQLVDYWIAEFGQGHLVPFPCAAGLP